MKKIIKQKQHHVVIIGSGKIGNAIASVLREKGIEPDMFDKDATDPVHRARFHASLSKATTIFLCVHSWIVRTVLTSIVDVIPTGVPIVSIAKGIEKDTDLMMDQLVPKILGRRRPFVMLSGPMLAIELSAGKGGAAVAVSRDTKAARIVAALFSNTTLTIETSTDVRGVVLAGVLKNVYALLFGMAHGCGWGENNMGWLTTHAVREMEDVIVYLGGNKKTAHTVAGIGDLITTGFSTVSSNHTRGVELAKTGKITEVSEGIASLPALLDLLGKKRTRFLLIDAVKQVVQDKVPVADVLRRIQG